jgi:hypothetical protein
MTNPSFMSTLEIDFKILESQQQITKSENRLKKQKKDHELLTFTKLKQQEFGQPSSLFKLQTDIFKDHITTTFCAENNEEVTLLKCFVNSHIFGTSYDPVDTHIVELFYQKFPDKISELQNLNFTLIQKCDPFIVDSEGTAKHWAFESLCFELSKFQHKHFFLQPSVASIFDRRVLSPFLPPFVPNK